MRIKRYHEAPKSIFNQVQELTDGDYALVHLFETDTEYFEMFKKALAYGRDVILDNSIFELGESFDHDRYAYWINRLQPTWYIVPDVWKDSQKTIDMFFEFFKHHPRETLHGKVIGVAQGHTYEDVVRSYIALEPHCDMIAFNFDFSSYAPVPQLGVPKRLLMSLGRWQMLTDLRKHGVINPDKPHHLLGCGVPQEICWYPKSWEWVRSIDTCHPVMEGMNWLEYEDGLPGTLHKTATKMCTRMDYHIGMIQWRTIKANIKKMESWNELRPEV